MASIPGAEIPSLKLSDGASIPMIGYGTGTAWFKHDAGSGTDRALIDSIKTAIKLGYYHLDAAEMYNNEEEVGLAIKESKVPREKLFVTSKVGKSVGDIPKALDTSLKKLGLEYLDLYLIHTPFFASSDSELQSAWSAMESVQASGKARSIGVSNYTQKQVEVTLAIAKVPPSINQVEYHPYLQHENLVPYMKSKGIATAAYAPLTPIRKARPGPCDTLLEALSKKYYVSEGEIALRWCIDQGIVVITTSSNEQRLSDYLRATTFRLTPKEVRDVSEAGILKHYRGFYQGKYGENDKS